ncbi:hypothetical protein CR513_46752, partial [Mucuna pruriens]
MNLVSAFNIQWEMARTNLSSIFVPFLVLLMIAFTFFAHLTLVSADLKIRKLRSHPCPPPAPTLHRPFAPGYSKPNIPPPQHPPRHGP